MKRYIKPNTELHSIELTQMIAESGNTFTAAPTQLNLSGAGAATSDVSGGGALGKESTFSIWSDSDEEE